MKWGQKEMKFEPVNKRSEINSNGWDIIATEPLATALTIGGIVGFAYLFWVSYPNDPTTAQWWVAAIIVIGVSIISGFFTCIIAKKKGKDQRRKKALWK
jgi:heme A synthase